MTIEEFTPIMAYLEAGSGSGKPATKIQCEVYFDMLKHLPAESVKRAAKLALADSQYPTIPPVGVLLKLAGAGEVKPDARAIVAYAAAARAVQSTGAYQSVNFSDPLVNAVIRSMGGWERFCDWSSDEVQWRKRDFEQTYSALCQAGTTAELAAPLAGLIEIGNSGAGYLEHVPEPVAIGVYLPNSRAGLICGEPKSLPDSNSRNRRIEVRTASLMKSVDLEPSEQFSANVQYPPADIPKRKEPAPVISEEEWQRRKNVARRSLAERSEREAAVTKVISEIDNGIIPGGVTA